ncbi:MAG: DinB family protein [Planctomycetota bacterium]
MAPRTVPNSPHAPSGPNAPKPPVAPATLIAELARAPEIIVPLAFELPAAHRKTRPAPGKWSVHEHACHLAVVHGLFFTRLDKMLAAPGAQIVPYNPDKDEPADALLQRDLTAEMDRFTADRAKLVGRLKSLSPTQWTIEADHPEYARYSIGIMFRHLALHDLFHAYRIEELVLKRDW